MVNAIVFDTPKNGPPSLHLIDQRRLPLETVTVTSTDHHDVANSIREMVVRGAPAIGIAAAYGIAIGSYEFTREKIDGAYPDWMEKVSRTLGKTRPTAVNLFWAIDRMRTLWSDLYAKGLTPLEITRVLYDEARSVHEEDISQNRSMGKFGHELFPESGSVLTHCNAGALATGGYGTALGVIRAAVEAGKKIHVFADETRPYLQGARLTAYELMADNIPTTLITDGMSASLMAKGKISAVIVGADRITRNGDVANKIGTYALAVLAHYHKIPFYVAAPFSTIDFVMETGNLIPIEERSSEEVTTIGHGNRVAPIGVDVYNPAFDVTPAGLITRIITERGVFKPQDLIHQIPSIQKTF